MAQAALATSPAPPGGDDEKYKIQVQLSEAAKDRLLELKSKTDAKSAAQVVREALRVYDALVEEVDNGVNELIIQHPDRSDTKLKLF